VGITTVAVAVAVAVGMTGAAVPQAAKPTDKDKNTTNRFFI
jgi:hypothetical protein